MRRIISIILAFISLVCCVISFLANRNIGKHINKNIVIKGVNGSTSVFIAGRIDKKTVIFSEIIGVICLIGSCIISPIKGTESGS